MNRGFSELHDSLIALLEEARAQQTHDELILQTQLFSRIAFVSSQMKDIDFATHRRIVEHGLRIGNTAAECVIIADGTLDLLSNEAGQELMEIATVARKDFIRIPSEFVHPFLDKTQHMSKGLLNQLMQSLSQKNIISNINEIIGELEQQQELNRKMMTAFNEDLKNEIDVKNKEMNYMKAEVFPILEYSLRYFRQGTDKIIASLADCNA